MREQPASRNESSPTCEHTHTRTQQVQRLGPNPNKPDSQGAAVTRQTDPLHSHWHRVRTTPASSSMVQAPPRASLPQLKSTKSKIHSNLCKSGPFATPCTPKASLPLHKSTELKTHSNLAESGSHRHTLQARPPARNHAVKALARNRAAQ